MGLIRNLINGMKGDSSEFKAKLKEAQMNDKIEKTLIERSKSSNRRELEKYIKDQEEAEIKSQLDKIHKKQTRETWKSSRQILDKGKSILTNDRPILKEKNVIIDNKNKVPLQNKRQGMFFRW